ncbi:MAG: hypothetical protein ACR2G6_15755 [Gemmatimonadaceae bacterium]
MIPAEVVERDDSHLAPAYAGDVSSELLRGLLRALHPFDSRDRNLAVMFLYGDASGTRESRIYAVACYYGAEHRWAAADAAWAAALKWAKVDHFHATDFFACQDAFGGWKRGSIRHKTAERKFLSIASDAGLFGSVSGVETGGFDAELRAAFHKVTSKHRVKSVRTLAFLLCYQGISRGILEKHPLPTHERISIVLESEKGIGEVIDYFWAEKKKRSPWTKDIITIAPGDKKEFRALQMADLLAYEARDYLTIRFTRADAELPPRLARLAESRRVRITIMNKASMRQMIPELQALFDKHPHGFTRPPRRGSNG